MPDKVGDLMRLFKLELTESERSVFLNFVKSYLVIFLIPIFFFATAYQIITNLLTDRETRQTEQVLNNKTKQVQLLMDEYLERSLAISLSILKNDSMSYLLSSTDETNGNYNTSVYRLANHLNSIVISNNFVDDIIVCVNDKEINVNCRGMMSDEDVYKNYIEQLDNELSYEDWIKVSENFTGGKLYCLRNGTLYFIQTFPVTPREDVIRSITLIKFRDGILKNAIEGSVDNYSMVPAIIDNKTGKNIIGQYWNNDFDVDPARISSGSGNILYNGYIMSYEKSDFIPVTYAFAFPQEILSAHKQEVRIIAVITFIVCTVLGCALIYFLTLRNYNPIRQLFSLAKGENTGTVVSKLFDPYSEIKSILLDAADQKIAYMNLHKEQDGQDRKRTLIAALYDKKSASELIGYYASKVGINYEAQSFCFIKLKCTDISSYFEKTGENEELAHYPVNLCETIVTQILGALSNTTCIRYDQELIFIAVPDIKKLELFNKNIEDKLSQAQQFLRENYGIDTIIAVSDLHQGIEGIRQGFHEMNKTMEYIEITGNKVIARYNRMPSLNCSNKFNTTIIKEETMMLGYVKSGDFGKAKSYFNKIINIYFNDTVNSPQVLKFKLYGLINNILGAMNYVSVPDAGRIIDKVNEHNDLLDCENLVEFQSRLNTLFDELEEFCRSQDAETESHFKRDIMEIVRENYMNPDLNVSMIADMMNKNLDYVSRTFKKLTGYGLLDYIHEVRINKAKDYFQENPDLTVQQVSAIVGYISCESFIRVFKRREGVTPGRFKAILEQSASQQKDK